MINKIEISTCKKITLIRDRYTNKETRNCLRCCDLLLIFCEIKPLEKQSAWQNKLLYTEYQII